MCTTKDYQARISDKSISRLGILSATVAALLAAPLAVAKPVVNGSEISWPDDGWYQVQTMDTYEEVCGGGRSCNVTPGLYRVINHSTGQRFSNIEVKADVPTSPDSDAVTVTGNVISWPDDGWYQVQTKNTHEEVCSGGRSCEVPPGIYKVINHTTGQIFRNIEVNADNSSEPDSSAVVVTGNVISWPDNGWYQVLKDETYEEVCGGGLSCEAEPGTYIVINHSTGERFKGITVNADAVDNESPTNTTIDLLDISQKLIVSAAGYQLDRLAVVVDDIAYIVEQQTTIQWPDDSWYQVQSAEDKISLCNGGAECNILPGSYVVINHSTGERSPLDVPFIKTADQPGATQLPGTTQTFTLSDYPEIDSAVLNISRTHYSCDGGGSLILEYGNSYEAAFYNVYGNDVGGVGIKRGYVFDQCKVNLQNGLLPDDTYEINGNLQVNGIYSYGDNQTYYIFDELSLIGENGVAYKANGQTEDTDGYDFNYLRSATIAEYQEILPGVGVNETLSDVEFNYETLNNTIVLAAPVKTMTVNAIVSNAQTANQQVTIKTEPVLNWGSDPFVPFNGSIKMQAEDGSFLYQNANPYVDPDSFWALFADFDYTAADGEQTQLLQESYTFPFGYGDGSCFLNRVEITGRLNCPELFSE